MKKVVSSLAAGFFLAGTVATSVSAQEYKVKEGDTLGNIAESHDTTVDTLKDRNDLDTLMIHPNETLNIDSDQKLDQAQYKVQEGDTLGSISKDFDVSVSNLKKWNDLDSNLIIVDQILNVQNIDLVDNNEASEEQGEVVPEDNQADADQEVVEEETEAEGPSDDQAAEQEEPKAEEPQQEENDEAVENNEDEAIEQEPTNEEPAEQPEPQEPSDDQAAEHPEGNDEEPTNDEGNDQDADTSEGETMTMSSTAYTAGCDGCSGTTANGTELSGDEDVVAVDPDEIPIGSEVHVEGYGDAVAADTGGNINGDRIDLHMGDKGEANDWGNQDVEVTVK